MMQEQALAAERIRSQLCETRAEGKAVILDKPAHTEENGKPRLSALVSEGARRHELWFRASQGPITAGIEPFIAASLFPAMRLRAALRPGAPVSARLLRALPEVQQVFSGWYPDFAPIPVEADAASPAEADSAARGTAAFFTGGVDSFYTLACHRDEITALIFVHGFDIPLDNAPFRTLVSRTLREITDRLALPLIEVETNLRDFSFPFADWGKHYHGAALASVALLLAPQFRKVYVPASNTYPDFSAWGSHPHLDHLWSTERTELVYEGFEASRYQKIERLAEWELPLKYLRVCYANQGVSYNCGVCEKCLRTMISLRIAGALPACATFCHSLDLSRVARLELSSPWLRLFMEENLRAVEERQDPALEAALRACLKKSARQSYPRYFARLLRHRLRHIYRARCARRALRPAQLPSETERSDQRR